MKPRGLQPELIQSRCSFYAWQVSDSRGQCSTISKTASRIAAGACGTSTHVIARKVAGPVLTRSKMFVPSVRTEGKHMSKYTISELPPDIAKIWTTQNIAAIQLEVTTKTIREMVKRGELRARPYKSRLGYRKLISKASIAKVLKERKGGA